MEVFGICEICKSRSVVNFNQFLARFCREKTIAVKPSTLEKIITKVNKVIAGASPADFQSLAGSLAFAAQVGLENRTYTFYINQTLASLHEKYGHAFSETGVVDVYPELLEELEHWRNVSNHDKFTYDDFDRVVLPFKVYTDSSSKFFGVKMANKQVRGDLPGELALESILVKECYAILFYVRNFAPARTSIHLLTDNKGLYFNYLKRYSRNGLVNQYLREIFKILRERKSVLELSWISTSVMASDGADALSRNFVEKFADEKSLSPLGKNKLLRLSGLDVSKGVDVFASGVDNPFEMRYCHVNWDLECKLAMKKDGFQFLNENFGKKLNLHLFCYPPLDLMDEVILACKRLELAVGGKLILLVVNEKAVQAKLALGRVGTVVLVPFCKSGNRLVLKSKAGLGLTLVLVSRNRKRKI